MPEVHVPAQRPPSLCRQLGSGAAAALRASRPARRCTARSSGAASDNAAPAPSWSTSGDALLHAACERARRDATSPRSKGSARLKSRIAVQAAFIAEQAAQCGYCTNGMIMAAKALLARTPKPTLEQVKQGLAGNLCRCGTHTRILRAVMRASRRCSHDAQHLTSISRRDLLKAGGALVVSFAFAVAPRRSEGAGAAQTPASAGNTGRPLDPGEVDGLLAIHADGSVTIYTSKVDVGTGLRIALAQMAAEELGVAADAHHRRRGRHRPLPRSGRHGREHRPDARRHRDPSGRGDRASGAAGARRRAAQSSGRRSDDRRRRGAAAGGRRRRRHRHADWRSAIRAQGRSPRRR